MAKRRPKPSSSDHTVQKDGGDLDTLRVERIKEQVEVPPSAWSGPQQIGPYRVNRVLGSGGMGIVYAALDESGREVAVKMLNTRDPEFAKRFAREAKIRVESKHVVRVFGSGTDERGSPYIVFELLEGRTLADVVDDGPVAPSSVVDIGVQVLSGLATVHSSGVVHRDIKPANLFVTEDSTVKLLDFGIAMVAQASSKITQSGGVIGTPSYLSPEQAVGDQDIDETTDLWSLGVVLYELLSGKTPFGRQTAIATLLAIVREPMVPLRDVAPDVPLDLATIIEQALEKERAAGRAPPSSWPP